MYNKRKDYSKHIRESTQALRIVIKASENYEEIIKSLNWSIKTQFPNVREICFQYEENQLKDFKILREVLLLKKQFGEIFINEEENLNGDYLQAHYTPVFFKYDNEWISCYVKTLKVNYDCCKNLYDINDTNIALCGITEFQLEGMLSTPKLELEDDLPTELLKFLEAEKDLIIIPKKKVFINRNENFTPEFAHKFDFSTTNLFYINEISYERVEEVIEKRSPAQLMDIDLENSDYEVTKEFLDMCFKGKSRYLTFQNSKMDDSSFGHLLDWLMQDKILDYLEFHGLDLARLEELLNTLKGRPCMLRLVLFFSKEMYGQEESLSKIKDLVKSYRETRPFVYVTVDSE